jgi:Raf kinase inhibitor-like YbhB/YbcL family protein
MGMELQMFANKPDLRTANCELRKKLRTLFLIVTLLSFLTVPAKAIELNSPAFKNNDSIPKLHTCDGKNISPSLGWKNVPKAAQSLAIICDDPDAPVSVWVHWVVYNIPPAAKGLNEGVLKVEEFVHGARQGINDYMNIGYDGPCPPKGIHGYSFKLYALDSKITPIQNMTKEKLLTLMKGHILEETELVGKYDRKN